MKASVTLLALALSLSATAQVGIGTTAPDSTAVLEVASGSKALVIPRLSAAAMNAIAVPVEGSIVYNTTARRFFGYGGTTTTSTVISQTSGSTPQGGGVSIIGQSFTVTSPSFVLYAIDLYSTGGGSLALAVTLRSGAGLTGPVVATASTVTPPFGPVYVNFFFSSGAPVVLQSGSVYTICVQGPNGGNWSVGSTSSNPYAGGTFFNSAGAAVSTTDLNFIVRKSDAGWKQLDD